MNTHYAEADKEWDQEAREQLLDDHKKLLMPKLERRRAEMFSPDWQPNEDWWGSEKMKKIAYHLNT